MTDTPQTTRPDDLILPCPHEPHACWKRKSASYRNGLWRRAVAGFAFGVMFASAIIEAAHHVG